MRLFDDHIRKAERRVNGLTTIIANLERQELELNDEIAQLEATIENCVGDVSELRLRIAELESNIAFIGKQLTDKRLKLKTAGL